MMQKSLRYIVRSSAGWGHHQKHKLEKQVGATARAAAPFSTRKRCNLLGPSCGHATFESCLKTATCQHEPPNSVTHIPKRMCWSCFLYTVVLELNGSAMAALSICWSLQRGLRFNRSQFLRLRRIVPSGAAVGPASILSCVSRCPAL